MSTETLSPQASIPAKPGRLRATKRRKWIIIILFLASAAILLYFLSARVNLNPWRTVGQPLDSLDGVVVYHNGGVGQVQNRNTTPDGYNLGLRYQCVEFVKRYYWQHFQHKMPDAYGHVKDFFDPGIPDGAVNPKRGLRQFSNGGGMAPQKGDLLVFAPSWTNRYGHVAIVSRVGEGVLEMIQQNPGPFGASRVEFLVDGANKVLAGKLLGWLRMP